MSALCPICSRPAAQPGTGEGCERYTLAPGHGFATPEALGPSRARVLDCERTGRLRAQRLAGALRRAVLDTLLPVGPGAPDPDEALRRLARAAHDVPQEWEP